MKHVVLNLHGSPGNSEPPELGEWQEEVNQWGGIKRYRMVGNVKEYEMEVNTSHGTFRESELQDFNRKNKEQSEQRYAKQRAEEQEATGICPFKVLNMNASTRCDENCAFFKDGCRLSSKDTATEDTAGKYCPLARTCNASCAMYKNGCTLFRE